VTFKPDVADALTVTTSPTFVVTRELSIVIDWSTCETVIETETGVALNQFPPPLCVAIMRQVPASKKVRTLLDTLQIALLETSTL
jgi:hypothetical protein